MFDYDGNQFELEDPVLLTPEDKSQKPYVAILKDITQDAEGDMWVTGQWFYRPEEAEKKGGGSWQAKDSRELFYSFHLDDVPAESVMHKCVVHFVPLNKKLPMRSQNPGFIVQKVYDAVEKKLWKLTDKDYEDNKQHQIDLLVQKTIKNIGEFPDIEPEDAPVDLADLTTSKRSFRRKNMHPIDVSKTDDASVRSEHHLKPETPGSCPSEVSEYHVILSTCNALTGNSVRDKWLEKLLEAIQAACNMKQDALGVKEMDGAVSVDQTTERDNIAVDVFASRSRSLEAGEGNLWPEVAVQAVTALEKASHETLGSDFQRYNKKMRQLVFNLKNTVILAKRLLNKELDPVAVVNMTQNELKKDIWETCANLFFSTPDLLQQTLRFEERTLVGEIVKQALECRTYLTEIVTRVFSIHEKDISSISESLFCALKAIAVAGVYDHQDRCNLEATFSRNSWKIRVKKLFEGSKKPTIQQVQRLLKEGLAVGLSSEDHFMQEIRKAKQISLKWVDEAKKVAFDLGTLELSEVFKLMSEGEALLVHFEKEMKLLRERSILYCICRKPYDQRAMVACDQCDEWYHFACINLDQLPSKSFCCPACKPVNGEFLYLPRSRCSEERANTNEEPRTPPDCHNDSKLSISKRYKSSLLQKMLDARCC